MEECVERVESDVMSSRKGEHALHVGGVREKVKRLDAF
jgi:hypothetical protein